MCYNVVQMQIVNGLKMLQLDHVQAFQIHSNAIVLQVVIGTAYKWDGGIIGAIPMAVKEEPTKLIMDIVRKTPILQLALR